MEAFLNRIKRETMPLKQILNKIHWISAVLTRKLRPWKVFHRKENVLNKFIRDPNLIYAANGAEAFPSSEQMQFSHDQNFLFTDRGERSGRTMLTTMMITKYSL